jgi:glycoprotein 3-alpha-L-fucosyltransferase
MVIFSLVNPIDKNEIPKERNRDQQWTMVIIESPINVPGSKFYNLNYNLSVTYRSDSDTYSHYAYESELVWELNEEFDDQKNYLEGKTEFSVALISNCHDKSGRLNYINEMKKYVSVKIFGKCGDPCPSTGVNCKEIVSKTYKFYLAFENSLCKDYITEKFFISLRYDIIPVVLGIGEYEKYVPKSGYINVMDYKSPKELSEHLIYLSNNSTAYNSYFKWKKYVKRRESKSLNVNQDICELCIKLHHDSFYGKKEYKTIDNLSNYWNHETDCKSVSEYPALTAK